MYFEFWGNGWRGEQVGRGGGQSERGVHFRDGSETASGRGFPEKSPPLRFSCQFFFAWFLKFWCDFLIWVITSTGKVRERHGGYFRSTEWVAPWHFCSFLSDPISKSLTDLRSILSCQSTFRPLNSKTREIIALFFPRRWSVVVVVSEVHDNPDGALADIRVGRQGFQYELVQVGHRQVQADLHGGRLPISPSTQYYSVF